MPKKQDPKTTKYGDDNMYESPFDTYIFHPLGLSMVDLAYKLNLTPNQITLLSTIFTLISCYWIVQNKLKMAVVFYLIGYIFDCIDGRLARKYDLGTKEGAAMDLVSDVITNTVLLITLILFKRAYLTPTKYLILFIFFVGLTVCHGFTEAVLSEKKNSNDNFLNIIEKNYGSSKSPLFRLYVYFNKNSYNTYRCFIPKYNERTVHNYIKVLKYFGPGTFIVVMSIIILGLK